MRYKPLAFLTIVLLALAGGAAASPKPADTRLDRALARLVSMRAGPPGAVVLVQRGSKRAVFVHGVADRSTRRRIALGDRWRIASVSKAFSGAIALTLVSRGKLSLGATIGGSLPQLPKAWAPVTLKQALRHTSGLPDYSASPAFHKEVIAHPRRSIEPSRLLSYVAGRPLEFRPGSRYRYSNSDNIVVAMLAQAATGHSYERVLHDLALDRLGLRRTTLPGGYRMPAPYVHGYDGRSDVSEALSPTLAWASGGIVSTPLDLTRFIRAYAGGKLFHGAARRAQLRFRLGESEPAGPGRNDAGPAIFRYRTKCGTVYGHTGNFLGYTAFIAATRDGRRSVVVQASTQLGGKAGDPRVVRALRNVFALGVCSAMAG